MWQGKQFELYKEKNKFLLGILQDKDKLFLYLCLSSEKLTKPYVKKPFELLTIIGYGY